MSAKSFAGKLRLQLKSLTHLISSFPYWSCILFADICRTARTVLNIKSWLTSRTQAGSLRGGKSKTGMIHTDAWTYDFPAAKWKQMQPVLRENPARPLVLSAGCQAIEKDGRIVIIDPDTGRCLLLQCIQRILSLELTHFQSGYKTDNESNGRNCELQASHLEELNCLVID